MEGARIKLKQKKDDKKEAEFYDTSKVDYHNIGKEIKKLEKLMRSSATDLDFEKAAFYRDLVKELKEKVLIKRA